MARDALRPTAPALAPAPAAFPGPGKGWRFTVGDLRLAVYGWRVDVVRRFWGARSSPSGEAGVRGGGGDAGDSEAAEGTCSGARGGDSQDASDDAKRYADWEITACMTTDGYFTSLLLACLVFGTRTAQYRRLELTYAGAIFTVLAVALVTHLSITRHHAGFYRRHRIRILVAMRVLVPVCVLGRGLSNNACHVIPDVPDPGFLS